GAACCASRSTTRTSRSPASGSAWPARPSTPSSARDPTRPGWYNSAVIVSHEWKFIFVKTRKTAGSSIERFLLPHLGADDVIRSFEARNARGRFNPRPELAAHHDRANVRLTLEQW